MNTIHDNTAYSNTPQNTLASAHQAIANNNHKSTQLQNKAKEKKVELPKLPKLPTKVKVFYTIGLTMFVGGLITAFLGVKVFDFSHVIGLVITFSSIPVFMVGAKYAPKEFLENSGDDCPRHNSEDDFHRYYSTITLGSMNYRD